MKIASSKFYSTLCLQFSLFQVLFLFAIYTQHLYLTVLELCPLNIHDWKLHKIIIRFLPDAVKLDFY